MLHITLRIALAGAALLVATQALAQTSQPLKLTPEDPPRWDAAGGAGLHVVLESDRFDWETRGETRGEVRFDVGRYWTTHLKTELGISLPHTWTYFRTEQFPVAGLPLGGSALTDTVDQRLTSVSPAVTYQFLENTFAHPYVSTGVRLGLLQSHAHRPQQTRTVNRISYTVPAFDRRTTSVLANPFVAAGFKSYFSDRVFVRSEGLAALGSRGVDQMTFRLTFGLDF